MPAAKATPANTTELKSISVRLENRPGSLAGAARALAKAGVNIEGVEAEVLGQSGFFRFFTKDEAKAEKALREAGYVITVTEILEVFMKDKPGELARAYETLAQGNVNGESCFGSSYDSSMRCFLRVSDAGKAFKLLTAAGFQVNRLRP